MGRCHDKEGSGSGVAEAWAAIPGIPDTGCGVEGSEPAPRPNAPVIYSSGFFLVFIGPEPETGRLYLEDEG